MRLLFRRIGRTLQDAWQLGEDWRFHQSHRGPAYPPRWQRVVEQARLLRTSALDAEDYYRLGLHRPDLSFEEKSTFLGKYRSFRYYDQINPQQYEIFGHDKALMHWLALPLDVPMPRVLATIGEPGHPGLGERIGDVRALRRFLSRPEARHLFLKPVTGTLGAGALALGERVPGSLAWQRLPGTGVIGIDDVVAHTQDGTGGLRRFLIQPRIAPHRELARIVPDVLHTVRVGTYVENGRAHILGACLRMGNGLNPTDNSVIPGGISIAFDLLTGELGAGQEIVDGLPRRRPDHPVTGVRFEGSVLPYWREALEVAEDAARKFSFMPWLSWDVGISESGPVITEFNTRSRWTSVQLATGKGLLAGRLGAVMLAHRRTAASGLRFAPEIVRTTSYPSLG